MSHQFTQQQRPADRIEIRLFKADEEKMCITVRDSAVLTTLIWDNFDGKKPREIIYMDHRIPAPDGFEVTGLQ